MSACDCSDFLTLQKIEIKFVLNVQIIVWTNLAHVHFQPRGDRLSLRFRSSRSLLVCHFFEIATWVSLTYTHTETFSLTLLLWLKVFLKRLESGVHDERLCWSSPRHNFVQRKQMGQKQAALTPVFFGLICSSFLTKRVNYLGNGTIRWIRMSKST